MPGTAQAYFLTLFPGFSWFFIEKSIDFRPWRRNIIWKLLRNNFGMIDDLLEIHPEPFLDAKVNIWNTLLNINFPNTENQHLTFKSQHIVINPDQGPPLKCAPGHDSIEDSSIIKIYYLRRRVMAFQNLIFAFWAKSGWGQFLNRFALRWPRTNLRIFWKFSNWYHPNQNHPTSWGLGCMLLGSRVVPNREFSEKIQSGKPSGEVLPVWSFSEFFRIGFQKRI